MYQVLHDTNNVTDSGCHCVSAGHSSSLQGCWQWQVPVAVLLQVQNCLLRPSIWDKSRDFEIGQWGRPWLVWYVPCKRRCVPRFTKLKHRHRHRKQWSSLTLWNSLSRTSGLGDSQSVIRTTLFSLSQTNYYSNHQYNDSEMCYYNPLHRSRRFINQ